MQVQRMIVAVLMLAFVALSAAVAQNADQATDRSSTPMSAPSGDAKPASALAEEEAAARFDRILQRRPFHKSAFTGLVRHYLDHGKLDELVERYEARMAALPDDVATKIVTARLYLRTGKTDKAIELLATISKSGELSERDESHLLVFKSEVYQRVGRLDEAEKELQLALDRARSISERMNLSESLADLHLRAGDKDKAAAVLTKLAEEYADSYLHRKRIADTLAQRDLHDAAIKQYLALVDMTEKDPDRKVEVLRQLGKSYEKLDRTQDAIDAYSEAIALLTGDHWLQEELHHRIVTLYRQSGRLEDLVKYCRERIEKSPEQSQMRMLLADVQAAMGDKDAAKATLEEATTLFPKDIALSERRISMLDRYEDQPGVVAEYERIISQHPDDVELYVAYGQYLAANQHLDAARGQWQRVLKSEMTDATLARRLGSYFEPYEMYDDAAECYERSIELAPKVADGYEALSRLYRLQGAKEKAVEAARRMGMANPDDPYVQAVMYRALSSAGAIDEALGAIQKACELNPKEVRYQLEQADVLVRLGRVEDALKVRRDALALMPSEKQVAIGVDILVSMYATANKVDELIASEKARLADDANNETSLLILARAADYKRDFKDAQARLEQLLKLNPGNEAARRQLARLYEAEGDVEAAVAQYKRLIEGHPERGRDYYQSIADLRLRYNDKAGAVETFEKMVEASPNNATVLKSVAEQMGRLGEVERGLKYFETATRLQPDRYELQLSYGDALVDSGRLEDAMKTYRIAAIQRTDRETAAKAISKLHEVARQLGETEDLIQDLQARAEADPEDTLVARALAELLIQEYEYNRAIDWLDVVLRYHPRDVDLQMVRAEIFRRLARFDDAVETYRRVLRFPGVDRDYVLGELGKAFFESGSVDEARAAWRQIQNKLYAGTLLKGNGLFDEAIEVFRDGIRMKPDAFELHRQLVVTLNRAGRTDEALEAARHLLDLEPDNVRNIEQLAKAFIEKGDRKTAAKVASRLFSAGVGNKQKHGGGFGGASSGSGGSIMMAGMQAGWSGYQRANRSNLDRAVSFFTENGLLAELKDVLGEQLESQPDNAVLKLKAYNVFEDTFSESEKALKLLEELETASFPIEHQPWLGTCSQRDYFRVMEYSLIAQKPALRDARLADLEAKRGEDLSRDETIELAVIRQAQGSNNEAAELLERAVKSDDKDIVALSALVDILLGAERYEDAEPFARRLVVVLSEDREALEKEMVERARRDFVRSLPIRFQLRMTDDLLKDVAHKWALGNALAGSFSGGIQTAGYLRAQLNLATILAKTDRMDEARSIWKSLEPTNPADADGWTMLAGIAQLHDQNDLAYTWYEKSLSAVRQLAGDQLLQRIYSGTLTTSWYGEQEGIDSAFNAIVKSFAERDKLVELYDFLRETDQLVRARRIAEQYKMYDPLKEIYAKRVEKAKAEFKRSSEDALTRSVPYFAEVCKLAELYDRNGDWPKARETYNAYLEDFPDELGLLQTLGEVAEHQEEYAEALTWEKKVVATKERLARDARNWALRNLSITPDIPRVLEASGENMWSWQQRWGRMSFYWGGMGSQDPLAVWTSWLRIARLHLSLDNTIAAGDALERAVGSAGTSKDRVGDQVLSLIRERKLTKDLLPVLRSLAVSMPTNENVQIAFAESLEANDKKPVAVEVYQRLLRRGVSDVGRLAQVRRQLEQLRPAEAVAETVDTVDTLRAAVKADPDNARNKLRLAKALYYSLDIDEALAMFEDLEKTAPHLEGLHELLVEIYTIRNEPEKLIAALRQQIDRAKDDQAKRTPRFRLAEVLLEQGRQDEALETLAELANPRDPNSYQRVGILLHYFGKHDEALKQFESAKRSQSGGRGWMAAGSTGDAMIARSLLLKGDIETAADRIVKAVEEQMRQSTQYGGMMAIYGMYGSDEENHFQPFSPLFVLRPALADAILNRLEAEYKDNPDDPLAAKRLLMLHKATGRLDLADKVLERLVDKSMTDQGLAMRLIDRAVDRREYEKAAEMAKAFIVNQPKPQLPPGMPPQYAGMMQLMSARNVMLCKLGDIYWKMDQPEKAFAQYKQIRDEKVDITGVAYAAICMIRGRVDEAKQLLDETLAKQDVDSPELLQFRAVLAILDDDAQKALDLLERATTLGEGQDQGVMAMMSGGGGDAGTILENLAEATGQVDRYASFLRERIEKNPNDWSNHAKRFELFKRHSRTDEARAVLDEAEKVKSLRQQVLMARIGWMEGHAAEKELIDLYRSAIEAAERKVDAGASSRLVGVFGRSSRSNAPTSTTELRNRLGELLWKHGEHEEAESVWKERMNLKEAGSYVQLGQRFSEHRAFDKAKACYEEALRLDPKNAGARRQLAIMAFADGDVTKALTHVRELFEREQAGDNDRRRSRSYDNQRGQSAGDDLRAATAAACADPATQAPVAEAVKADESTRLAVSAMTGDWDVLEAELDPQRKASPYDLQIQTLWAKLLERKGDWQHAAKAWEYVRRLKQTSLPGRLDKLKLVLAGKQIKTAAAGMIQAPQGPAAMAAAMRSGSYQTSYTSYGGYYWGAPAGDLQHLAALYVKLGDFEKAERAYLISSQGGSPQSTLPMLAGLMWRQGAKQRAANMMELAMVFADDVNLVPNYARLLDKLDRTDEAIDLLSRAYRSMIDDDDSRRYYMYYGGFNNREAPEFENWQESQLAETLYDIADQRGKVDDVLKANVEELKRDPADGRLAKLTLSLQLMDRRWEDARATLIERRKSLPEDNALRSELLRVEMQLGNWDGALAMLAELKAALPEASDHYALQEAFVRMMQNQSDDVRTALAQLATQCAADGDASGLLEQIIGASAVVNDIDGIIAILEKSRESERLDDVRASILYRADVLDGRPADAARLAMDRLWTSSDAIQPTTVWWHYARVAIGLADEAGKSIEPAGDRPEDGGLLALARDGADAAKAAFHSVIDNDADDVNARRGLVLAIQASGDDEAAAAANAELTDWLAARRRNVWRTERTVPVQKKVADYLEQLRKGSIGAQGVLTFNSSMMSFASQILSNSDDDSIVLFEPLWQSHEKLQTTLLIRAGDTDGYVARLKRQTAYAQESRGLPKGIDYSMFAGLPASVQTQLYRMYGNQQTDGVFARDWRAAAQNGFATHREFNALLDRLLDEPAQLPASSWPVIAEWCAAANRPKAAAKWKRKAIAAAWAKLEADDLPDIDPDANDYSWYWGGFGRDQMSLMQVRQGLMSAHSRMPDELKDDAGEEATGIRGAVDEIWEWALLDKSVEARLKELENVVGPGWASTETVKALIRYDKAKKDPQAIIALVEKVASGDELLKTQLIDDYLSACFDIGDDDRIERVLHAATAFSTELKNECDLVRLAIARKRGDNEKADALEAALISRCRSEPEARWRVDDWLAASEGFDAAVRRRAMNYRSGYNRSWRRLGAMWGSLARQRLSKSTVAQMFGVDLSDADRLDDVSLGNIQYTYLKHHLYDDACRIQDLLASRHQSDWDEMDVAGYKWNKTSWLASAGRADEAKSLADEVEQYWQADAQARPFDAAPHEHLARLYASRAYGRDYEKAREAVREARKRSLSPDRYDDDEALYCYKSGDMEGAWRCYRRELDGAKNPSVGCTDLYRAGIAACKAGATKEGRSLLRQALWRDPLHGLAKKARELTHEDTRKLAGTR